MGAGEIALAVALTQAAAADRFDPAHYPARDAHEGVTLAVRPLLAPAELTARFGAHPLPAAGVLLIEILLLNERPEEVRVAWERAVVLTADTRLEQLTPEEIARRAYPLPQPESPVPWPEQRRKWPKDKKREARESLAAALAAHRLRLETVPAGGRVYGFLYFDAGRQLPEAADLRLYLPEVVRLPGEEPLMFFEVEFAARDDAERGTSGASREMDVGGQVRVR